MEVFRMAERAEVACLEFEFDLRLDWLAICFI